LPLLVEGSRGYSFSHGEGVADGLQGIGQHCRSATIAIAQVEASKLEGVSGRLASSQKGVSIVEPLAKVVDLLDGQRNNLIIEVVRANRAFFSAGQILLPIAQGSQDSSQFLVAELGRKTTPRELMTNRPVFCIIRLTCNLVVETCYRY
jgi:hypothetical protein